MSRTIGQPDHAQRLMREALSILDEAGESVAAAHLQAAIDTLAASGAGTRVGAAADVADRIVADPALVRALGGALAVFGTLMERKGIASLEEIANILGIYAVTTAESASREEGLILGCLAAILKDAGPLGDAPVPAASN